MVLGYRLPIFFRQSIFILPYHKSLPVPQDCYHSCLVKIALVYPRNLMIFSRRFSPTYWPK